jgi:hypothetical protein
MGVLFDLLGIPGLTALMIVVLGAVLVAIPRRILVVLSDSFAIGTAGRTASPLGMLVARLFGAALIGYAFFLAANIVHLADAMYHSQPTPDRPANCSAPFVPRGSCPTSHPSR